MTRWNRLLVLGLGAFLWVLGPWSAGEASASGLKASAPGVTSSTITIGFITSETGIASSTFLDSALGAQVRIDAQNAAGGVDGRKIKLIVEDDQSSPTEDGTAASALLSQGVFGIINFSPFAFGSDKILQQAGVPVTGGAFDGPEWGEQPFTNMFSYGGGLDPHDPASTVDGLFLKSLGATKVGGIAYGVSPSSTNSIKDLKESVQAVGLSMPYEDLSFPFGSTDTTVQVLEMKQTGVNAAVCSCVQSTNIALIVGAEQAGLKLKGEFSFSGADSSLFAN